MKILNKYWADHSCPLLCACPASSTKQKFIRREIQNMKSETNQTNLKNDKKALPLTPSSNKSQYGQENIPLWFPSALWPYPVHPQGVFLNISINTLVTINCRQPRLGISQRGKFIRRETMYGRAYYDHGRGAHCRTRWREAGDRHRA